MCAQRPLLSRFLQSDDAKAEVEPATTAKVTATVRIDLIVRILVSFVVTIDLHKDTIAKHMPELASLFQ